MDVVLSDYSCVFFEMTVSVRTDVQSELIRKRAITENFGELFIQAFSSSPPFDWISINDFADNFSPKIANVIDGVPSTKVKVVSGRKKKHSPWRNAMLVTTDLLTNLHVHYDIYKERLNGETRGNPSSLT